MTNEIDLLRITIKQYDRAKRLKSLNEELYSHLIGSVYYLLKYSEKYDIPLPRKKALFDMVEKADFIIDQFAKSHQPKGNTKKYSTDKEPEPETTNIKYLGTLIYRKSR